ncbi:DNA-deoxyinosine glycosylase [Pseudomonadota bacterium]
MMSEARGFPPVASQHARVLILGSMPGRESLERRQYYAHPRNAFWPIMRRLFGICEGPYGTMTQALANHGVAVWDVLQACFRPGSLDSNIDAGSMVTNDFPSFFAEHPRIKRVFFNGAKAESIYVKQVLPHLDSVTACLPLARLPSTSPAHAGMNLAQKTEAWRVILDKCLE